MNELWRCRRLATSFVPDRFTAVNALLKESAAEAMETTAAIHGVALSKRAKEQT